MTPLEIRRATAGDVPLLSATGMKVFAEAYAEHSDADAMERHVDAVFAAAVIAAEMRRTDVEFLLAMAGDECAGFVKLRCSAVPDRVPDPTALEVQHLYVSSCHQRRGVGRRLMDRAVESAGSRGAGGIWLTAWSEADWATAFYKAYGFVSLGDIPFMLAGVEYVDWLMWLPIEVRQP